jgi:hypothetical protein
MATGQTSQQYMNYSNNYNTSPAYSYPNQSPAFDNSRGMFYAGLASHNVAHVRPNLISQAQSHEELEDLKIVRGYFQTLARMVLAPDFKKLISWTSLNMLDIDFGDGIMSNK